MAYECSQFKVYALGTVMMSKKQGQLLISAACVYAVWFYYSSKYITSARSICWCLISVWRFCSMSENQSLFKDWMQHSLFTFSNRFMLLGSKSSHLYVFHETVLDVYLVNAQNHQKILINYKEFREKQPFLTRLFWEKVKRIECTLFAGKNKG